VVVSADAAVGAAAAAVNSDAATGGDAAATAVAGAGEAAGVTANHTADAAAGFAAEVEAALAPLADPARAASMRAYMGDRFPFLGLPAPVRRAAVQALVARPWASAPALLDAAGALWQRPARECRYTAIDLLLRHRRLLGLDHVGAMRALLETDPWWDTVDGLTAVLGKVMHGADRAAGQVTMDTWVVDASFWVRRAALLHQLGWRMDTDRDRLFGDALRLAGEKEFSSARRSAGRCAISRAGMAPPCRHSLRRTRTCCRRCRGGRR
jgi:3-methyladenine DNA glycosylase AlkD